MQGAVIGLLERLTLLTDRDNASALRFYERNGFTRSGMAVLRQSLGKGCALEGEFSNKSETGYAQS
jgi:ribosomal protein S18 acetylase RimI-like enzyme